MEVKPYDTDGSKKAQVSKMFDNIAGHYDFLNHFLSLGIDKSLRRKMIAQLDAVQPHMVLDVATGTADVAIATARQYKSVENIVGVDISNEMLAVGRKKILAQGLDKVIELQTGDSENLPFSDNIFDAITVAYGVRNFEHLEKGLSEMYRVLKPNGKLIVLEFSKPSKFPMKQLFNFYFANILPVIGRITSRDPRAYAYLYESVQVFPDGQDFVNVLTQTGFKQPSCQILTFGISSLYTATKVSV